MPESSSICRLNKTRPNPVCQTVGSVVRAFDFYPGGPVSNPIRDVEFVSNYASSHSYEFSYS